MEQKEKHLFKNSLFRKLFFSYVVLILFSVAGFSLWYLYSYNDHYRVTATEQARQQAMSFATELDRSLLTAQGLCGAMNASENVRNLYQAIFVERKTPDSMLLYRAQTELTRIKASAASLDIYAILLGFTGGNKLYAPGMVIALEDPVPEMPGSPWIDVTNVVSLLKLKGVSNIILNKEFLVYSEGYTGNGHGTDRGFAMVLMEKSLLENRVEALRDTLSRVEIRNGSRVIYQSGTEEADGEILQIDSLVSGPVSYRMQISEKVLSVPFPLEALLPLGWMVLGGALFMGGYYFYLRRRYHPISAITRLVSTEQKEPGLSRDMDAVVRGISDLIGERNGYRERMITISPYAHQGALHQLISGTLEEGQIEVLREEQFLGLRCGYYMVGLVNLALTHGVPAAEQRYLDLRSLAQRACEEMSEEEHPVVTLTRDVQNLYVVASGDRPEMLPDLFYRMLPAIEEAADDPDLSVTIGVSSPQTELDRLRAACREAARTLENMITGGRGSVYFAEEESRDQSPEYDLPRDTQARLVRDLKENNQADINALLDKIWEKNIHRASLAPDTVRRLVEELYLCVNGALREISEQSMTHLRAERIREPATVEEIFAYYRSVLLEACRTCQQEGLNQPSGDALEKEIASYINEHILDPDLSLSAVADHFGVSGKMVGTVCKNSFGKTYLQYVRDSQIQHAVTLLQTTDLPLEEIASRCGFTNLLTFRRNFKAAMGVNPSDYRRE
jgi:AraC-like DNA-binding protein